MMNALDNATVNDEPCSCTCCPTIDNDNNNNNSAEEDEPLISLRFLSNPIASWIQPIARSFEQAQQGRKVKISFVQVPFTQQFPDIINEAKTRIGLYDGYISPPTVAGSIAEYNGWADLKPFIQSSEEHLQEWSDVLLGYRQAIAQYEDQIIMYPLDGDILSMYYRKDVLEHFQLNVPRTWPEYQTVAEATHGKVWQGKVLSGSCIGRQLDCAGPYWANLLLSSITQTNGAKSGHLFDTANMKPLTGPALELALQWMVQQVARGAPDEFEHCFAVNTARLIQGECVLTYNWGNTFKQYLMGDSVLRGNKMGVAPTPGSTLVLDRETMTLVPCDEERCKHGDYYDDIGWVNRAPYLAFGGWACSVNNYTNPVHKQVATEFCAFASSRNHVFRDIIPNATNVTPMSSGQDPFRTSHLNVELYVSQGYERIPTEEYLRAIQSGLNSPNVVTDCRFPSATSIYEVLDQQTHDLLNRTRWEPMSQEQLNGEIQKVVEDVTKRFQEIIAEHDARGSTPVLEIYQRLRGVHTERIDNNYLGDIRIYGGALASLNVLSAVVFMSWTIYARKSFIVRASQPTYLAFICAGAIIMGSSIITLGLDDENVGRQQQPRAASRACMTTPWLLFVAQSLNLVYQNAMRQKRVIVSWKDVALPLAFIMVFNITLLSIWTVMDPAYWERRLVSENESIGRCRYGTGITSKICYCLIGTGNGLTLLYTNYQAYRARHLASEYGESQQIAMAMGSILQIVVISVPLLYIVEDNPVALYFLDCSIVFVACMSILCLIFVPKICSWWLRGPNWDGRPPVVSNSLQVVRPPQAESGDGNVAVRYLESAAEWSTAQGGHNPEAEAFCRKLADLTRILTEAGVEPSDYLAQAGLTEQAYPEKSRHSSLVADSMEYSTNAG